MKAHGITHIGLVRERNEDRFLIREMDDGSILLAVADGMGGHAGGDKAAQITIDTLAAFPANPKDSEKELTELARTANRNVLQAALQDPSLEGMGSTLTAAFVAENVVHWVHAGDSRLYLNRESVIVQITEDHTILGLMLQQGHVSTREAHAHPMGSALFNCVGREPFRLEIGTFEIEGGDLLLFTTDGLHDRVTEEQVVSIILAETDLESRLTALVDAALAAGGRDNITVVALENR